MVWTIGGTMNGNSRLLFDEFFRSLLYGNNEDHPKPKSFKLTKPQLFPEGGLVYDFMFSHKDNSWKGWLNTIDKEDLELPIGSRVLISSLFIYSLKC